MSFLAYLGGGALLGAAMRWWRPRPGWARIAAYWLLAGAFFAAPLTTRALQVPTDVAYQWRPWREMTVAPVTPANGLLSDVPLQIIPFRALVRERLLRLEAPLWAGEMGTGQPLLGNAQSAPFSPLGLLALPLPAVRSLPVVAALKLFLSLLLTDALLAALGAGRAGACFAAVAFTFSLYSICWACYPLGVAAAWLPGMVLGLVLLRRGERGGLAGLTACATGMALSGHPETLAHAALAAVAVAAAMMAGGARAGDVARGGGVAGGAGGGAGAGGRGAARWRYLGGLAAATVMSAGLAAPALLPFVEALPETARARLIERTSRGVQPPDFAAATLQLIIDPLAYGSPRDDNWKGPLNFNELCSGYAGLLALALAAAAALTLGGRALAIVAGGAAALAAAFAVPPFPALIRAVPLLGHAASGRLRLLWVLAVAVAAGLGLEPLVACRRGRWTAGACAAAAALGLAGEGWPGPPWQRAWWLAAVGGSALTAAACCWAALRSGSGSERGCGAAAWLPWLAVGCLALDLALAGGRYLPILPARFDLAPPQAVAVMTAEMRAAGAGAPFRVIGEGEALRPNLAALYGLWDPRSDDPMQPARATLVVGRALRERYGLGQAMLLMRRPYPVPFLGYLGVRYMLTRHRVELFPPWEEAWDGEGGKLWRNPEALPLFFMPASWRPASDPQDALLATVANEDFAAAAVAETGETLGPRQGGGPGRGGEIAGAGAASPAGVRRQAGQVRLRGAGANGFALDVDAGGASGLVVSSVTFCRGWRLVLDTHAAELVRVNAGFLGFFVPPGTHRASLEYRPAGWVWGLRLCGLTVAGAILSITARRWRAARRRRSPAPSSLV